MKRSGAAALARVSIFKEDRPYTDIAQLRREIGKYVNEQEVARPGRNVTIR